MRAKHSKLKIKQACHNKVGRRCEKQQQHIAAKVIPRPKSLEVAVINQLFGEFPPFSFPRRWLATELKDERFHPTRQNNGEKQ